MSRPGRGDGPASRLARLMAGWSELRLPCDPIEAAILESLSAAFLAAAVVAACWPGTSTSPSVRPPPGCGRR